MENRGQKPYYSYFNTVRNQFLPQLRMLSRRGSPGKLVGSGTCLSQTFFVRRHHTTDIRSRNAPLKNEAKKRLELKTYTSIKTASIFVNAQLLPIERILFYLLQCWLCQFEEKNLNDAYLIYFLFVPRPCAPSLENCTK